MKRSLLLLFLTAVGCAPPSHARPEGVVVVVQEQQAAWIRNFNPFNQTGGARWPSAAGVYEPLLIYNPMTGAYTPWLAETWRWVEPARVLEFTVRSGVKWSDGTPFTAHDVAQTFALLKANPALDSGGAWRILLDVTAAGDTVVFTFAAPYAPGLLEVAHTPIVPAHIWRKVAEPTTFANEEPVATGPFTEVRRFEAQVFELGRNPHYWNEAAGDDSVAALRFPAMSSNDQITLALAQGDIDWAGAFVPAVERTFEGRDPAHHDAWFPLVGDTIFLFPNTTHAPLDRPDVRKALSLAIDREKVVQVAMYDYTVPSHPTGLSDGYADWRIDPVPDTDNWVRHDPEEAARLLDQEGFKLDSDGVRRSPDGVPLSLEIATPAGWSDWVRAAQVIARDLRALGIDVTLQGRDFTAWFDRVTKGEFALTLGWAVGGPTPYRMYKGLLASEGVVDVGTAAVTNWHRFGSVTADVALDRFEQTTDPATQRAIARELQQVFLDEAPALPLFPSASWGEANTRWVTGFPSEADPYARLSPNSAPEPLLVMSRLRWRDAKAAP